MISSCLCISESFSCPSMVCYIGSVWVDVLILGFSVTSQVGSFMNVLTPPYRDGYWVIEVTLCEKARIKFN